MEIFQLLGYVLQGFKIEKHTSRNNLEECRVLLNHFLSSIQEDQALHASVFSRGMNGSAWKGLIHLVSRRKENSLSSQMIILISISIAEDQWKLKLPWKILILIGMKVTLLYRYIKKKALFIGFRRVFQCPCRHICENSYFQ